MKNGKAACPKCGHVFSPPAACPECGTTVDLDAGPGCEEGDRFEFKVDAEVLGLRRTGESDVAVELRSEWASTRTRHIFGAVVRSVDGEAARGTLGERTFLVEETDASSAEAGGERVDGVSDAYLRWPVARVEDDGSMFELHLNRVGISVEKLVELAQGEIHPPAVVEMFRSLLEAIGELHGAGRLHLQLAPSEVWCGHPDSDYGIPPGWLWGRGDAVPSGEGAEGSVEDVSEPEETVDMMTEGEWVSGQRWLQTLGVRPPSEAAGLADTPAPSGESLTAGRSGVRVQEPAWEQAHPVAVEIDAARQYPAIEGAGSPVRWLRGYAAPEMAQSAQATVGPPSDVFALGMILYFLVAGRHPPTSVYTRQSAVVPARTFRPDFPPGLEPVISRATHPEPEKRYPDVSSLKTGFEEAVDGMVDRSRASRDRSPTLDVAVDRHTGIEKRESNPVNQDDVVGHVSSDGRLGLVAVADGVSMASYGSGDIASDLLVQATEARWEELVADYRAAEIDDPAGVVRRILEEANEEIVEYVRERHTPFEGDPHEVMGTTGLVALYLDGRVTLGSIGDSRVYIQRGPGLERMTVDHNLWTLSVLEGVPADDALSMPRNNALARCLGTFDLEDDELQPAAPDFDILQFRVASGDRLLLTTDGLVDFAGSNSLAAEESILSTLQSEPDPALACLELILLANRGGGGDNIGVGIATFS